MTPCEESVTYNTLENRAQLETQHCGHMFSSGILQCGGCHLQHTCRNTLAPHKYQAYKIANLQGSVWCPLTANNEKRRKSKKQDKHLILYYVLNTLPCTKHSSITFDEQHVTKALLAFSELQEASFESFFQLCENKLHEKTFIHTSMAIWKTLQTASFQQH